MMKFFIITVAFLSALPSMATECDKLEWTKKDSRTQGGSWIWFPGKARAYDKGHAITLAEGAALDYMAGECGIIHKDVRFNERCIEKSTKGFEVFVRASVTHKQCEQAKSKNPKLKNEYLNKKLATYRTYVANKEIDLRRCNSSNPQKCFELANEEWKGGNSILAWAYAKRGCSFNDVFACGFLGYLHFEFGNYYKARKPLKRSCLAGNKHDCDLLKVIDQVTSK